MNWFLAWRLHSTYPTLCCKGPLKRRALPSWTLSQNFGLRKFRHSSRSCCQQNSSRVELVDHTYEGRRTMAVYYTSVDCNPLTPLLRSVVDLLYNLLLQLGSSWQDFVWYSASCGPSPVAGILVLTTVDFCFTCTNPAVGSQIFNRLLSYNAIQ